MWKWLGGCLLVVVVLFAALFWWSLRTIRNATAPDGSVSVTIGAAPERVYASMSHNDSIAAWMARGTTLSSTGSGPLKPGDVLSITIPRAPGTAMSWEVAMLVPNQLIVMRLRSDSSGRLVATRRDSLSLVGDSTRVRSILTSPILPGATPTDSAGDPVFDMTANLVLSMFRLQSKIELSLLKERIEGATR